MSDPKTCLQADNKYANTTRAFMTQMPADVQESVRIAYQMGYMHGVLDGIDEAEAMMKRKLAALDGGAKREGQ